MNALRRKNIQRALDMVAEARSILEEALELEQEAYDNLPESIQDSDRGYAMDENCTNLQNMIDSLEEIEGWEEA